MKRGFKQSATPKPQNATNNTKNQKYTTIYIRIQYKKLTVTPAPNSLIVRDVVRKRDLRMNGIGAVSTALEFPAARLVSSASSCLSDEANL